MSVLLECVNPACGAFRAQMEDDESYDRRPKNPACPACSWALKVSRPGPQPFSAPVVVLPGGKGGVAGAGGAEPPAGPGGEPLGRSQAVIPPVDEQAPATPPEGTKAAERSWMKTPEKPAKK